MVALSKPRFFLLNPFNFAFLKKKLRFSRFFCCFITIDPVCFPLICKFLEQIHLLFFGPKKLWNTFLFLFAPENFWN
jgi:hypothetical protein